MYEFKYLYHRLTNFRGYKILRIFRALKIIIFEIEDHLVLLLTAYSSLKIYSQNIRFKTKLWQSSKLEIVKNKLPYGTYSKTLWGVSIHWTGLLDQTTGLNYFPFWQAFVFIFRKKPIIKNSNKYLGSSCVARPLFSCRGIITFSISTPRKRIWYTSIGLVVSTTQWNVGF